MSTRADGDVNVPLAGGVKIGDLAVRWHP